MFARQSNIFVGTGRGSVAGSLVAYLMEITQVDPIFHSLSFARFLSADKAKATSYLDYV